MAELTVLIKSFSYKDGIPGDESEHGGGFVFDCRCLPNPGREDEFRSKTGLNSEVQVYLKSNREVQHYRHLVFAIIDQAVGNYLKRGFEYLSVSFGCTGGQHRSVFFAEELKAHLEGRQGLRAIVSHDRIQSGN